jgi:hypothetical protein
MEQNVPSWVAPLAFFIWLAASFWIVIKHNRTHDRYLEDISKATNRRVRWISIFDELNIHKESSEAQRLHSAYWRAFCRLAAVLVGLWLAFVFGGWLWVTLANFLRMAWAGL